MTSCVPPQLTATYFWSRLTATPWASLAALPCVSSESVAYDDRAVERNPRQPLAEHPAQVDVVLGRREPPIAHVGDVARSCRPELMATWRRLSPSIGMVFGRPSSLAASMSETSLRPRVADEQLRPVGRKRDAARLAADSQPAGDLAWHSGRRGPPRC